MEVPSRGVDGDTSQDNAGISLNVDEELSSVDTDGKWKCAKCGADNTASDTVCSGCSEIWQCRHCKFHNARMDAPVCEICLRERKDDITDTHRQQKRESPEFTNHPKTSGIHSHSPDPLRNFWKCQGCTFRNHRMEAPVCEMCGGEREGVRNRKRQRTGPIRELRSLTDRDADSSGIDWHSFDPSAVSLGVLTAPSRTECRGGDGGRNRLHIVEAAWDGGAGGNRSGGDDTHQQASALPIHFRRDLATFPISEAVLSIRAGIMAELSQRANENEDGPNMTTSTSVEVKDEAHIKLLRSGGFDGYYKAHLQEGTIQTLLDNTSKKDGSSQPKTSSYPVPMLPPPFVIHEKADQKGMAFINTKFLKSCDTHSDRDNSILWVIEGRKRVMLARPPTHLNIVQSNSTIFEDWKPFDDGVTAGGLEWKSVVLDTGDALFLPKHIIHAVQSDKGTFALSFQVQRSM